MSESLPSDTSAASSRPNLRISSLHIRNLKAIHSLDLPEQGLGWSERIPDVVLVGGANGSGKTTLLELFVEVMEIMESRIFYDSTSSDTHHRQTKDQNAQLEISIQFKEKDFRAKELKYVKKDKLPLLPVDNAIQGVMKKTPDRIPAVIYFPSNRQLSLIETKYKMPGLLTEPDEFVYVWRPPTEWKDSLEALLYSARWADLSALGAGEPVPGVFDAYADEFHRLMEGKKRLVWSVKGILGVQAENGERHGLEELSSGEKQILVMMTELKRRWRPGSLVLIDEPELHLHSSLQTKLYERIVELQKERGGQVWLATQSNHLFKIAAPYTKVLLESAPVGSERRVQP